jgi:flagellar biosynthetic protein FliR
MPDFIREILTPGNWPTFVFITTRLTGMMITAPLWSMTPWTRTARTAATVLLAILLLPGSPRTVLSERMLDLPIGLAMELLVGIVIGLTAAVIVQGIGFAGEVISLQMGLGLGPALAPMPDLDTNGVGQLKALLALFIYTSVGGHLILLKGLAESLHTLPPGMPMNIEAGGRAGALLLGGLYSTALRAAAPVMVSLLLTNIALAIMSRAVPQLNIMIVALPVTIAVGLVMLGACLPFVASAIHGWFRDLPATVQSVVETFRPIAAGH